MALHARPTRRALVTGGTSGIGLETARALTAHFEIVGIVGRDAHRLSQAGEALESTAASIETFRADFSSLADVRRLAGEVRERFPSLSLLVNNAAVWHKGRKESRDGYEETFAVNHLAHFLITNELEPLLSAGAPSRVVNVSSSVHLRPTSIQWDDLMFRRKWRGFSAYAHSKLANVVFSHELARRWSGLGITSNALNPGNVRSRITRNNALLNWLHRSPLARVVVLNESDGAKTPVYVATAPELEGITGRYFDKNQEAPANPICDDEATGARLWEVSEALVAAVH